MVCKECKSCKKFISNDCCGASEFNKDACQSVLENKKKEVDVSGCC